MISFTLREPFLLLNRTMRMNHHARRRYMTVLAREIDEQTIGRRPPRPYERAWVRIYRFSAATPDTDNLYGGAKFIVDCLTTPARTGSTVRNRFGLGFVVDDSPKHIALVVHHQRSTRAEQCTRVEIAEIPSDCTRSADGLLNTAKGTTSCPPG